MDSGTDHAGIATQMSWKKTEKQAVRHDLGWKISGKGLGMERQIWKIISISSKLGSSMDLSAPALQWTDHQKPSAKRLQYHKRAGFTKPNALSIGIKDQTFV